MKLLLIPLLLLTLLTFNSAQAQSAAPSATPLAHPAAPTPNTKVNFLWTYASAATGRPETGVTYIVYRCTGASCTPTSSVATGLTVQYYENTGLTANTVYGYAYTRDDGAGESAKSPTVYVTTTATDDNLCHFPNSDWEFLLGPCTENPGNTSTSYAPFSWMNTTDTSQVTLLNSWFPDVAPNKMSGTVTLTNGSATVTGTGTFFLQQLNTADSTVARGANYDKMYVYGTANTSTPKILSIASQTSLTLESVWTGTTQTNVDADTHNINYPGRAANDFWQVDTYYNNAQMYVTYLRTGDTAYLAKARRASDAYFAGSAMLGRETNITFQSSPRQSSLGMFFARAIDGRPEMWDWIVRVMDPNGGLWDTWIDNTLGGVLIGSVRDQGYTLWYGNLIQKMIPRASLPASDGTCPSADGCGTALNGTTIAADYKTRLEAAIPVFETWQTAHGSYQQVDQAYPDGEQIAPLHTTTLTMGITLNAMDTIARNSNLNSTATNSARKQLLRGASFMGFAAYPNTRVDDNPSYNWRATKYLAEGGSNVNPEMARWQDNSFRLDVSGYVAISGNRQQNSHSIAALAAAYMLSGQTLFKTLADEHGNAMFAEVGENTGATGDGHKSYAGVADAKLWGEPYMTAHRWLGWRLESPASLGTPPTINAGSDLTLTGGVNVAKPVATGGCTNTPCTDYWTLTVLAQAEGRYTELPWIGVRTSLTPVITNMEPGLYTARIIRLDALGMMAYDDVQITVGAGQFGPTTIPGACGGGYGGNCGSNIPGVYPIFLASGTTSVDLTVARGAGYPGAAESFTYSWSIAIKPKNAAAPTVTNATSQTCAVSGLSDGDFMGRVVVTGATSGTVRVAYVPLTIHRAANAIPTLAQNSVPIILAGLDQILPAGSTTTYLIASVVDPKGWQFYNPTHVGAPGYESDHDGGWAVRGAGTHTWTCTSGCTGVTITNGSTLKPTISGLTAGQTTVITDTYNDGLDDATDSVTITVQSGGAAVPPSWRGRIQIKGRIVKP